VTRENERLQRLAAAEIQIAELPPRSTQSTPSTRSTQSTQPPAAVEAPTVPRESMTRAVTVPEPLSTRGTGTGSAAVRAALDELRQAEALADNGEFEEARAIYRRLVSSAPREIVAVAAVGLYRIGSYRDAVDAFQRLGAFARGEEDLHYYYAVSLYEAGQYDAARRELACALPFIEVSDEVARYRLKIEQTVVQLSESHL
jgi:tetratricopeptide (TPR) repeat protein